MTKRINVFDKDGNKIEIWDNEIESFEKKGFKKKEPNKSIKKIITINKQEDKK